MRLGYAYSRYPVLSQTFCDAEMLELERRGHEIVLGSLYPPKTELRHEYLVTLRAPVHHSPGPEQLEALAKTAKRQGRWPRKLVRRHERQYGPSYKAGLRARNALFFVDLFEQKSVPHFHVHFANRAAHTALFVRAISGIPFSITAHGQDFMADLGNLCLLREICDAAEFIGVETDYSRNLLASQCPNSADKIVRVYNGLDLSRFPGRPSPKKSPHLVRLLSVGRLVAFKGFEVLIDACAALSGLNFECEIIGDGPLRQQLQSQIKALQLEQRLRLRGEQSQSAVLAAMRDCDIFVLASLIDERGASDVFPTVIAEAMASGKPVISTTVAGIPELVVDGQTGLLAPPGNALALANSIKLLVRDQSLRRRFGLAGRLRIEQRFSIQKTIEPLLERFSRRAGGSI